MNKLRVIDILNKIANGEEVPKKIQVYSDIFVFDDSNNVYEHIETRTNLLTIYNGNILNYKVEIIEEDKKIERLPWCNIEGDSKKAQLLELRENVILQFDKINEIIDKLNEMGKE